MFPVDSIKVRSSSYQARSADMYVSVAAESQFDPLSPTPQTRMQVFSASPTAVYSGIGNAITRISSTEGARTLWRGVASVIAGAGPAHAVYFGTYEIVKEMAGGNRIGHQFGATGKHFEP